MRTQKALWTIEKNQNNNGRGVSSVCISQTPECRLPAVFLLGDKMKKVFLDVSGLIRDGENVVVCEKDGILKYPEENNEERKIYEVQQGDVIIYVKIYPDKDFQWYGLYQVKEIEEKVDGQTIVVEDIDDIKGVWIQELTTFDLYEGMEQWGNPKIAEKYAEAIEEAERGIKYEKEKE